MMLCVKDNHVAGMMHNACLLSLLLAKVYYVYIALLFFSFIFSFGLIAMLNVDGFVFECSKFDVNTHFKGGFLTFLFQKDVGMINKKKLISLHEFLFATYFQFQRIH